jgi:hypothetical protein
MTNADARLQKIRTLVADAMKDCWQDESDPDRVWRQDWTIAEIGKLVDASSYEDMATNTANEPTAAGHPPEARRID